VPDLVVEPSGCADFEVEGFFAPFTERPGQHLDQEAEPLGVVRNIGLGIDVRCVQVANLGSHALPQSKLETRPETPCQQLLTSVLRNETHPAALARLSRPASAWPG